MVKRVFNPLQSVTVFVIGLIIGLCAVFTAAKVQAQPAPPVLDLNVTVSWTIPTARENGVAITCDDISGYTVFYDVADTVDEDGQAVEISDGCATSQVFVGQTVTTTVADVLDGTVRVAFALRATDTNALNSALSNVVIVDYPVPDSVITQLLDSPPQAPVLINATGVIGLSIQ
jgi:hypothetical protein